MATFREIAGPPSGTLLLGIGDDAAVLRPLPGEDLVWTVDALEEEVDFRREWLRPEEVGARAVAVTLSDLAGMAARPLAGLLVLGSAAPRPARELGALFRGAAAAARRWGAAVAGGDLTRRRWGAGIAVTALGAVPRAQGLRRSTAWPGDEIWVTGTPGLAARGLRLLGSRGRRRAEAEAPEAFARYVRPTPRLDEAGWLAARAGITAGIDLSDGLALDLGRLCAASRLGAVLDEALVREASAEPWDPDLRGALEGGDDYELLLTAPPGALGPLAAEFERAFRVPIRRVGETVAEAGLRIGGRGGTRPLARGGWDHLDPNGGRR
ncbi:MAG TPA: thiamine-phosphate kinase [Gemmatimonadota bacterium]